MESLSHKHFCCHSSLSHVTQWDTPSPPLRTHTKHAHMHTVSQSTHLSQLAESGWEGRRAENKGEETVRENSCVFTVVLANLMWQSEKEVFLAPHCSWLNTYWTMCGYGSTHGQNLIHQSYKIYSATISVWVYIYCVYQFVLSGKAVVQHTKFFFICGQSKQKLAFQHHNKSDKNAFYHL